MHRLAKFDVAQRFSRPRTRIAAQLAFGLACAGLMIAARSTVDMWAPTSGPFALVYPMVMIATLFGHWQAGGIAFAASFLWAWYAVLPTVGSFAFEVPTDPSRVMINALAVLIVLLFAEIFRLAVVRAVAERDREIEHRKMLHAELDHRTKNNFALVASLLELQRRREDDPKVASALDQAISRVHSFAGAYANLSDRSGEGTDVAMNTYLTDVVERIADAAFKDGVKVRVMADPCVLPRETAVAIGLFTNEALTNCAKYAFPGDRAGGVEVLFRCEGENWDLIVRDDGIGDAGPSLSGLGMRLFEAFAKQAGGHYACETSETGRVVSLVSAASD